MSAPTTRTPPPEQWPDWRQDLVSSNGVSALAGIWLIFAPFALSYTTADAYWNDIVCGALIAAIAFIRIGGPAPTTALRRISIIAGAWIFVSAFWLDHSAQAASNDLAVGAIVFSVSLLSATATDRTRP